MCDEQRSAGDSPEENESCNIIVSREKETHICAKGHMVWSTVWRKNGVRCATKQRATMCTMYQAGCDEAGAHHRDTAHIFTRAEPETAAGHQRVDQSFQTLKAYVFTTVSFPRHPCLVINPRLVLSSHQWEKTPKIQILYFRWFLSHDLHKQI